VHGDGAFLLDDLDVDAGVPLLQAVGDGQTQHARTDDPHSLPAHGAPSGSVFAADGRLPRLPFMSESAAETATFGSGRPKDLPYAATKTLAFTQAALLKPQTRSVLLAGQEVSLLAGHGLNILGRGL